MKKIYFLISGLFLAVTFAYSQNVGIGITSPIGRLHVKGSANNSQLIIDANSTQSNVSPLLKLRNSSGNDLLWMHSDTALNTFIGIYAGRVNNAIAGGVFNTYSGSHAGFSSTIGNSNSGFGANSLFLNTTGSFNSAHGLNSLFSNASGSWNTAIGANALFSNTSGTSNTAIGNTALFSNINGSSNTASGTDAMKQNSSGSSNTANGFKALYNNTTGFNNTAIGYEAMNVITTGSNNTAIGYGSNVSNAAITNATAIGAKAYAGSSNSVVIGSINGINGATANANVGIGTATPHNSAALDVSSTSQGTLITRMTSTQRKAIVNPADGLLVYDIDKKTIYFYDSGKWVPMAYYSTETKLPLSPIATPNGNPISFGSSVSISGNYAIIGANNDTIPGNIGQGSAYIFLRIGGTWFQQAQLTASDGTSYDLFGSDVSINATGDVVVIGAEWDEVGSNDYQGSIYIFSRTGTVWSQVAKLTASDGQAYDYFGTSVNIYGDYIIAGAKGDDIGSNSDQGSAYIFYKGAGWTNGQMHQAKLTKVDGEAGDSFGYDVSISGDNVIIGCPNGGPGVSSGTAHIFNRVGSNWTQVTGLSINTINYGCSVAIDGDYAIVGANYSSYAYIYYKGAGWNNTPDLQAVLMSPPGGGFQPFFGSTVSISGNYAVVGASEFDVAGNEDQGSAFVYRRNGTTWTLLRSLEDETGYTGEHFSTSVGISGFNLMIGSPFKNSNKGEVQFLNIE